MSKSAQVVLRVGVAFAFLYPPFAALTGDPYSWLGYFPPFVLSMAQSLGVPEMVFLHIFGAVEVIVALWILSGWHIEWPALVATTMLLGIVVFNIPQFENLFRDLSIGAAALALALDAWGKVGVSSGA